MFCEKCGTQLPDDAQFCTKCGHSTNNKLNNNEPNIPDTEIQLQVKPTYKFWYMMTPSIIGVIIVDILIILIVSLVSFTAGIIFGVVFLLIFGIILAIKVAMNKKQYASYIYDFYKTKVIYKDSFLNVSEKEVKYKHIKEITMHQTFMQRCFNLGNIILLTNAETGFISGIGIPNVENVQSVYKEIKSIINI